MARRPCLICGTPSDAAYCPDHATDYGYEGEHWRALRRVRLALDGYVCQLRVDEGCTIRATTVHLDPSMQGRHAEAGLDDCVSACRHCHGVVDAPRATQGR